MVALIAVARKLLVILNSHDQGQKAVAVRLTSNTVAEGRATTKLSRTQPPCRARLE
jgi:hypothetical protein